MAVEPRPDAVVNRPIAIASVAVVDVFRLHEPLPVHERVKLLNEMAEQHHERDAARGADLARESIELARATGDALGEAQALYGLGRNLYSQADYPAVFETQNAALAIFRSTGDMLGESRCCNT